MLTPTFAFRAVLLIGFLAVLCLAVPAQANRTFVSAQNGNDANNCTLANPCRTFARAVTQVQTGGEIVAIDSGGYGQVTVDKAVSILAAPGVFAGIAPTSGDAITVKAGPTDVVVIRGLTLNNSAPGLTAGINFISGRTLHVENCLISRFDRGIYFNFAGRLHVRDTTVVSNGEGIVVHSISGRSVASIEHCRMEDNQNWGLLAFDNVDVTVRDSVASGNLNGFAAAASTFPFGHTNAELTIENCVAAGNVADGIVAGGLTDIGAIGFGFSHLRVSNSTITHNNVGLATRGGGNIFSRGNNTIEANITDILFPVTPYFAR